MLGVIHLPILGVTYAGANGLGATRNGVPIRLPESVALEDTIIATGDVAAVRGGGARGRFSPADAAARLRARLHRLLRSRARDQGALGAMLDPALNPWESWRRRRSSRRRAARRSSCPRRCRASWTRSIGNRALVARLDRELVLRAGLDAARRSKRASRPVATVVRKHDDDEQQEHRVESLGLSSASRSRVPGRSGRWIRGR